MVMIPATQLIHKNRGPLVSQVVRAIRGGQMSVYMLCFLRFEPRKVGLVLTPFPNLLALAEVREVWVF